MGVKGIFSYFRKKYQKSISNLDIKNKVKFDRIYLDANALLYPIADVTKNPEEIAKLILVLAQKYGTVFNCKVCIYMDGAAHMGKIRQQRLRRFLYPPVTTVSSVKGEDVEISETVYSKILNKEIPTISTWSPAMFSPGTEMMERISKYIDQNINLYSNILEYSSYEVSGEGEHKIINAIKDLSKSSKGNAPKVAIVGKDADLLFLGMSLTQEEGWNIIPYILRHNDQEKPNGYEPTDPIYLVDCTSLRKEILDGYSRPIKSIWNFIIAICVVGNDFLPAVPEYSDVYKTIPRILAISPKVYEPSIKYKINWKEFLRFFLATKDILNRNTKSLNELYSTWIKDENLNIDTFPVYYYQKMEPLGVPIESLMFSWITTVQWVFQYYYSGIDNTSVSWQYPFHYSPCLKDLIETLSKNITTYYNAGYEIVIRKEKPLTPQQALAAILPIWLQTLLSDDYQKKIANFTEYFPFKFHINLASGDPIIPVIPYQLLQDL